MKNKEKKIWWLIFIAISVLIVIGMGWEYHKKSKALEVYYANIQRAHDS